MKKRWKMTICLGLALILILGIAIYTKPMSMHQLCDEIDWKKCDRLKIIIFYPGAESENLVIAKEEEAFYEILEVFEKGKFRKSLWNLWDKVRLTLFPESIRFTYGPSETDWMISFDFDEAQYLADGNGYQGQILRVIKSDNITLDIVGKKAGIQLKRNGKEEWLKDIEALIIP